MGKAGDGLLAQSDGRGGAHRHQRACACRLESGTAGDHEGLAVRRRHRAGQLRPQLEGSDLAVGQLHRAVVRAAAAEGRQLLTVRDWVPHAVVEQVDKPIPAADEPPESGSDDLAVQESLRHVTYVSQNIERGEGRQAIDRELSIVGDQVDRRVCGRAHKVRTHLRGTKPVGVLAPEVPVAVGGAITACAVQVGQRGLVRLIGRVIVQTRRRLVLHKYVCRPACGVWMEKNRVPRVGLVSERLRIPRITLELAGSVKDLVEETGVEGIARRAVRAPEACRAAVIHQLARRPSGDQGLLLLQEHQECRLADSTAHPH